MGKRRELVDFNNLLHCDTCPFADICSELCGDMAKILKESGMQDAIRNEISHDPSKLDHMDSERGLYHNTNNQPSEKYKKSKTIVISFIMDFLSTRMTPTQREVLNLYFFQSIKEIPLGGLMGMAHQSVNEHKLLGLKKLRKYLSKFGLMVKPQ